VLVHEAARVVDHEALAEAAAQLGAEERGATGAAALQLAQVLAHSGALERARCLAERELQQGGGPAAARLLGWVIVQQQSAPAEHELLDDPAELGDALGHFRAALQQQPEDVEVGAAAGALPRPE
jgi:hypothetical protein